MQVPIFSLEVIASRQKRRGAIQEVSRSFLEVYQDREVWCSSVQSQSPLPFDTVEGPGWCYQTRDAVTASRAVANFDGVASEHLATI